MREELILSENNSRGESVPEFETPELKVLPATVRELFQKLPENMQRRIFDLPAPQKEFEEEDRDKKLEAIVAGFDEEQREEFIARCLGHLFEKGKFQAHFESLKEAELLAEAKRLMETLWQNRGHRDDATLFNDPYYEQFYRDRKIFVDKLKAKKEEAARQKESIKTTSHQKRLTEQKSQKLRSMKTELEGIEKELKDFDEQNDNSDLDHIYFTDVASRQRNEKEWTKGVAIMAEYFDPDEFAAAVSEQFDRTFFVDVDIAKNPTEKRFGRTVPPERVERAKRFIESLNEVVEAWHSEHKTDGRFKGIEETKADQREKKVIDYLQSLIGSYLRAKADKETDEQLEYTIRQMETSLRLLG